MNLSEILKNPSIIPSQEYNINDLVIEACGGFSSGLKSLLILVFILWLFQPLVNQKINGLTIPTKLEIFISKESLKFLYKWIGLGIIILAFIYIQVNF